jgi:predicted transcriptional regulator
MQLRIARTLPLGEVMQRVMELESKYSGTLADIPDKFANGQVDRGVFDDYVEWMGMVHAIRAWREGEDFDYLTEDVVELGWDDLMRLTPRRLDLLDQLSRRRAESINDLAKKIGRDVKNVYLDLKILEDLKLVRLVKEGRNVVPELQVHEVTILLW